MALVKCPECRGKISQYAKTCPHCGLPYQEVPNPAKNKFKVWLTRIGIGLLAAAVIALTVTVILKTRPQPALPRLSDVERMIFDAYLIGCQTTFDDPAVVTFVSAGSLVLDDQYSDTYPEGRYVVTVKVKYENSSGGTVTEHYHLTLKDYSQTRFLLADLEFKKGDMTRSTVPLLSADASINAALINQALQEYWAEQQAPAAA